MKFFGRGLQTAAAASALCVFLVACGGSEPAPTSDDTATSTPDVETTVTDTTDDVVDAATAAAETAETAVDDAATDAVEDVADTAEDAVEDVVEDVEDTAADAAEAVEDAVEDATDTAAAAADDRVSAEIIAQYAALTGDASNGRRVFTQCMACHAVQEGRNMAGPSLFQIVGRESGTVANFRYSEANANSGVTWTEETLFAYLEAPQQFIPGTIMIFPGLPDPQDRADVIAYLKNPR